jgi:soluble lytic murein transglycosylase-like protein
MISVQKAIFPGIALGCVFLVFITSLIANPQVALASNPVAMAAVAGVVQAENFAAAANANAASDVQESEPEAAAPVEEAVVEQPQAEASPPTSCSISASFPEKIQQWCGMIDRYAGENGVDANLIAAVMLQESGGNPDAYSKSGAVGLMQVMPRDGIASKFNCINGPCFAARPSMAELYDPEFNISYGTKMLAGLIRRHGDVRDALRAYGPMDMGYRYADIVLAHLNRYR